MDENEGGDNVVEFMKGVGDKKIVHLSFNDVDVDKLKEFLTSIGPDDYEIRQDALAMAVQAAYSPAAVDAQGQSRTDVLALSEGFYTFLKGGDNDEPRDAT